MLKYLTGSSVQPDSFGQCSFHLNKRNTLFISMLHRGLVAFSHLKAFEELAACPTVCGFALTPNSSAKLTHTRHPTG